MTREEAIAVLKTNYRCMTEEKNCPRTCEGCGLTMQPGELEEATMVAIKTLEPKTGHWIEHPTEEDYSVCSRCGIGCKRMEHGKNADGTKYIDIYSYNFCPYCGARMIEPQESEE